MPEATPVQTSTPRDFLRSSFDRRLAPAVFAAIILAALILFGAADRVVQIGLVFGLVFGFLLYPPEIPRLPRLWAVVAIAFVGFVVISQFLPANWFAQPLWRIVLTRDYGIVFPFTRNPEPGRAVDCILEGVLAVAWFYWVRTMACERPVRLFLIWALFGAAALIAIISIALGVRDDYMIYGVRYTPGWTGFGPFPNRNHTAALLAMGALAGGGCLIRAARRRQWVTLAAAILLEFFVILALLDSKSRGGLLGLGCGAALFAALSITKLRSRGSVAAALAAGLICATLVLSFGSKVLSRFGSAEDGNIPNNIRWQIWQDALRVWRDAPLWGHGLGTFAQVYPIYQTVEAHQQVILHPESSWLLWLDELGAIPVAIGAAFLLYFLIRNIIEAVRAGDRGYFIRVGAFAGVFALLCHGLWDVPVHRWGTAAFGIALLAIACPPLQRRRQIRLGRAWALAPAVIGVFWLLPFRGVYWPQWSPEAERRQVAWINYSPTSNALDILHRLEAAFPLDANLHEQIGIREIVDGNRPEEAWREFRIADRLNPSSWSLPAVQAWLSRGDSPGMSYHFWSLSIERAGLRAPDIFTGAYRNSLDLAGGTEFWQDYAEGHPELLLTYAGAVTDDGKGKAAYEDWWQARGRTGAVLEPWETEQFYACLRKWGDRAQLDAWIAGRPGLEASDYKIWASILHGWGFDADAWSILSRQITDPPFPDVHSAEPPAMVEADWRANPDDALTAQDFANECYQDGRKAQGDQVILQAAAGRNPLPWFIEKAAYIYAARKEYAAAVSLLLGEDANAS